MDIPRSRYAQGHLKEFVTASGIHDWFTFLDRPTRLIDLIRIAKPVIIESLAANGDCLYWDSVGGLVIGDNYGLWPNPSNAELFVAQRVENLHLFWTEYNCWSKSDSEVASQILSKYQSITCYETPDQLYRERVVAYQAKTGAIETVEEFERLHVDTRLAWDDWYYSEKASRTS